MELSILLAGQTFSMVLMILVGFFITRRGLLEYGAGEVLSNLTVYVLCPCLIFSSCQMDFSMEKLKGLLIGLVAAIFVHIVFIPLSHLLARSCKCDELDRAAIIYSNCGNLIVPLIGQILGSEFVFYSSAYLTVQTVLFWTHGIKLITGKKGSLKNIILNPNIIAVIAGLIFFLLPFKLPDILEGTIDKIGSTIGPMSMFSIGIIMSSLDLKKVFTSLHTYVIVFFRLVAAPVVLVLIIWASHVTAISPLAGKVMIATVLAASAPTAVTITLNSRLCGGDAIGAGRVNVMSTLLCVFTMPLVLLLYQVLCL